MWGFTVVFNKNTYGAYHKMCWFDVSDTPEESGTSMKARLYDDI